MVAITLTEPFQIESTKKPIILKGSLPGEGTRKGQAISICVTADDGVHQKQVELTKKIGEGGEGSVFETNLGANSDYVAKIYARSKLVDTKIEKLKLMLTKSIKLPGVCFPVALIKNEQNECVGFLMPRAEGVELGKSVFMPKLLQQKFPSWTRRDTIQLCITILDKIKYLNDRGVILGDINGQNILIVSPTEVYFVDCDSYQIGKYPCPAGTAHFTPPEAQGKDYNTFLRTQAMENFAIATLLFMIMLPGKAPYAVVGGADPAENIRNGTFAYESNDISRIPPGKWGYIWSHMSFNTRRAFVETFRKGGECFTPEKRMDAGQWLKVFIAYQHGIDHMLDRDPMAMDIFPTRPKMRECKSCGKMYVPDPNRYKPVCPECEAKERAPYLTPREIQLTAERNALRAERRRRQELLDETKKQQQETYKEAARQRSAAHQKWLNDIWKRYPCKNPKCPNVITLFNRDQSIYRNRHLPEYCNDCWKGSPCKKCGAIVTKWMYDEHDGLCERCYEKEQGLQHSKLQNTVASKTAKTAPSSNTASKTSNTTPKKEEGCFEGCFEGCLGYIVLFIILSILSNLLNSCS